MYTGPHIIKDGLVFGYDTGYGIADIETSTRFYPGKPTVNYVSDADTMASWNSYSSGNDGTFVTEFGTTGYRINNRSSWNGLYKGISVPATGTYTCSALIRYRGGSSDNNGATVYVSQYGSGDTVTSIDKSKIGEWQRIEKTVNVTDTDLNFIFYLISYGGTNATSSWDVTMPQVELASSRTPFVNGTRSSTASLIDLKETTDIDVSNVSFNSTGQPIFDGSNDKIVVPNQTSTISYTYETVVKISNSDSSYSGLGSNFKSDSSGYSGVGNGWVIRLDPDGGLQIYTKNNSTTLLNPINISGFRAANVNKYIHLVYTYSNGSNKLYLNGVLQATGTGLSGTTPSDSTLIIGAYSWGISSQTYYINAHQPIAKLYNQTHTATEIKQNFNAYKNRFDI